MRGAVRTINRWWVFLPVLAAYVALWLVPASFWFDSRSLKVSDAFVGEVPVVVEDRTIHWSFLGSYSASVRFTEIPQEIAFGCTGSGDIRYRGGLSGPKSYDLAEYADGKESCRHLPPGNYFVEVCRTVKYPLWGILPAKTACRTSNIFRIEAKK